MTEIGVFKLFITEYIISYMVQETNRYAKKTLGDAAFESFEIIYITGMTRFICLIIFIGINDHSSYDLYWIKNNPFY